MLDNSGGNFPNIFDESKVLGLTEFCIRGLVEILFSSLVTLNLLFVFRFIKDLATSIIVIDLLL